MGLSRWSSFHSSRRPLLRCVAPVLLFVACGGRSKSELDSRGDVEGGVSSGGSVATGGGTTSGGGGDAGTTSGGGGDAGTTVGGSGGAAGGRAGSMPDFDFTTVPDQATAYMVDAAHSGAALGTRIEPPLERLWVARFEGGISYPLVANGRVFVSANNPRGRGSIVHALDAATGEELWRSGAVEGDPSVSAVHLAYDRGLVAAADERGHVVGFEAATGDERWDVRIDSLFAFGSMPVAIGGAVFITGMAMFDDSLYVLDQRDGRLLFEGPSGARGHPTFGDGRIFASGYCYNAVGLDARGGQQLWHYQAACSGGSDTRTLFHDGLVLVHQGFTDPPVALDARTGALVSTIEVESYRPVHAVAGLVLMQGSVGEDAGGLRAFDIRTGVERWSVEIEESILHMLVTPGYVYLLLLPDVGGPAFLSAVDLDTHEVAWRATEPALEYDADFDPSDWEPAQALAAGGGIIVVPWERSLAAFRSAR